MPMVVIIGAVPDTLRSGPQAIALDHHAEHACAQHRHDEHEQEQADQGQAVKDIALPDEAHEPASPTWR